MTLISLCDDNQCTVDTRNWRLVDLFLRRYRAYLTSSAEPVIVEVNKRPIFIVSPKWEGDEDDVEDQIGGDPYLVNDDSEFLERVPFDLR